MTEEAARTRLASCVPLDQTWGAHSVAVARAAGQIAAALATPAAASAAGQIAAALAAAGVAVDPALARTGGLLHDIGRSVTHDICGHSWAGRELLLQAGEPALARFCTAHQLGGLTPDEAVTIGWPPEDYRPRTWEEKAVTIADGLAAGGRIVILADRAADVRDRYRGKIAPATYALLVGVEAKARALMAEVEAVIGVPTEALCGAVRL